MRSTISFSTPRRSPSATPAPTATATTDDFPLRGPSAASPSSPAPIVLWPADRFNAWAETLSPSDTFLSVITLLELRAAIENKRRHDARQADVLDSWLDHQVLPAYRGRLLDIDQAVADSAARLHVLDRRPAHDNALDKLRERGTDLPFPHTSAVVDADHLWELRPRGGDSPWRAFYRRMGAKLVVVGAIGHHDKRKYKRAVAMAVERLNDLKED